MKALVTGGAGFIGSHLVELLLKNRYEVQIADLSNGSDLMKPEVAEQATEGADVVFHLAADASVGASLTNHTKDLGGPTMMMNLLEAMNRRKINDMVFVSSSAVYGEPAYTPTDEECPRNPISLYGAAKLSSEAFARAFTELSDIRVCVLRLGNPVGEGARKGVVWQFTRRMMERPKELQILGDGQQTRSFFYVGDCVRGILEAYRGMKGQFDVFNVGAPWSITIEQTADAIMSELGIYAKKTFSGGLRGWTGDIRTSMLSCEKIAALGWLPEYTPEQAIAKAVEWSKSQS